MSTKANAKVKYATQDLRAQYSVISMNPTRTRQATLEALVSNPQAIRLAPMNDEPKYPAGNVIWDQSGHQLSHEREAASHPRCATFVWVELGSELWGLLTEMLSILAHVSTPARAWQNSCMPTVCDKQGHNVRCVPTA